MHLSDPFQCCSRWAGRLESVPLQAVLKPRSGRARYSQRTRTLPALVTVGAGVVTRRNRRRAPAPISNHAATAAPVASVRLLNWHMESQRRAHSICAVHLAFGSGVIHGVVHILQPLPQKKLLAF